MTGLSSKVNPTLRQRNRLARPVVHPDDDAGAVGAAHQANAQEGPGEDRQTYPVGGWRKGELQSNGNKFRSSSRSNGPPPMRSG